MLSSFFFKAIIAEFVLIIENMKNTEKNQKEKVITHNYGIFLGKIFFLPLVAYFPCWT